MHMGRLLLGSICTMTGAELGSLPLASRIYVQPSVWCTLLSVDILPHFLPCTCLCFYLIGILIFWLEWLPKSVLKWGLSTTTNSIMSNYQLCPQSLFFLMFHSYLSEVNEVLRRKEAVIRPDVHLLHLPLWLFARNSEDDSSYIIPLSTGATKARIKVIPLLRGKLTGTAFYTLMCPLLTLTSLIQCLSLRNLLHPQIIVQSPFRTILLYMAHHIWSSGQCH